MRSWTIVIVGAWICALGCSGECLCPLGYTCDAQGECVPDPNFGPGQRPLPDAGPADDSGFDDAPGEGRMYALRLFSVSEDALLDVDESCATDCGDNALAPLGEFANEAIRAGILAGESIVLFEIAGLDDDYAGTDEGVTIRLYLGIDADVPPFSANNFSVPPGSSGCCEFFIDPRTVTGVPPRPSLRMPARIDEGRLEVLTPISIPAGVLPMGELFDLQLELARIVAEVPVDPAAPLTGVLGGAVPAQAMTTTESTLCPVVSSTCPVAFPPPSTLLDFVNTLIGPVDVDVDGDGLECFWDQTGDLLIDFCCNPVAGDRCGPSCTGPGGVGGRSCSPGEDDLDDGYSINFDFEASPARVLGVSR